MEDRGARNLVLLVSSVCASLVGFYGFLAYRARLWSPLWAIEPTTRAFAAPPFEPPSPFEKGRRIYRELRCGVCHGPDGEGGVKNPNADPDGVVPNLYDLSDAFTRQDLKDKILKGAHSAKLEESGPEPLLTMPAWRKVLSDQDLEDAADYLFGLQPPPGARRQEGEKEGEEK